MAKRIQVEIVGDATSLSRAFRSASGSATGFGASIARFGRLSTVAFGAASAAAGVGLASAIRTTSEFDRSMRNVNSIARLNEKQFGALRKSVLGMAADVGQKPKILADGLYDIESSGFKAGAAVKILRASAKAATAGLTDTATASRAVTAALNAYKMGADKSRQVSDVLFQTVNKGVITFAELSQNMGDLVPAAAPLGVSLEEVGAGMATLTLQGVPAAEAATRMKNSMIALAKPTPGLTALLKKNGYESGVAAVKALGFAGTLDLISRATKGSVAAQAKLTPEIRTLLGVVGMTGKNLKTYNENLRAMQVAQRGAGITAQVFAEQSKSIGVMWQKVNAALDVTKVQLGTALLPLLKTGLGFASSFLSKFNAAGGFKAKIGVVFSTTADVARKLGERLAAAVASIDWSGVWSRAQGISDGLAARLKAVNWSGVGETIGNGIATGVGSAAKIGKQLASAVGQAVRSVDWNALGRAAGPGLAATMLAAIAALADVSFWRKNWDLVLAVGLTVWGGSVGRIAGRLAAPLVRVFGGMFLDVLGVVERFAPRIANLMLNVFMRLPGLISGIGSRLLGIVGSLFGLLGNKAKFVVKVLGIDVALQTVADFARKVKGWIDRIVAWFKALPGRIRGAIGNVDLSDIGSSIINSLWDGMKSKWEAVKGWASKVGGWIKSIKGPPAKDAVLLVENGQLIMQGLLRGLQSGFPATENYLSKVAGRLQAAMSRIQGQLDASQQRAVDASNRKALADAEKELAAARKKGKGIADAERAYQDALQAIRDTAAQRQLDRLTKQNDKILAKLQSLRDKAAAKLQKLQDAAGGAFDALAAKIQRAFDAKNSAFVSPAQQQINAINERRRQEDLAQAVTDAQQAVADAIENGGDVAGAQLRLQRAQEDIQLASLERQAEAQDRAQQQAVDAQQEQLDTMLAQLRKKIVEEGAVYGDGITGILGVIRKFDGDFTTVGGLLGSAFVEGLRKAMNAAAEAGAGVRGAAGTTGGGTSNISAGARTLSGASARVVALASGGTITRTGVALVHRGETVLPAGSGTRTSPVVNLTVNGWVGNSDELANRMRNELARIARREPNIFAGKA